MTFLPVRGDLADHATMLRSAAGARGDDEVGPPSTKKCRAWSSSMKVLYTSSRIFGRRGRLGFVEIVERLVAAMWSRWADAADAL